MNKASDSKLESAAAAKARYHKPTVVDRRFVLRAGALTAADSCFSGLRAVASTLPAGKSEVSRPVRLGVASYTFRNFERAQLIGFLKQLEVLSMNAKDVKDHLPSSSSGDELKAIEAYRANGIELTAAGTISLKQDDEASLRAKFEYCRRAGVKVMVAGDPQPSSLARIERLVREYDIRLAIHNHGPEDKLWHSPLDVLRAVKDMDPHMGCCIDVGHTLRAGVDVVAAIRAVGPRLFDVHMKDLAQANAIDSQVAVGRGIMPVRAIFQALTDIKYRGVVDLEYEIHPDDPMPGVAESFAYMRGVLAGMGDHG